MSTTRIQRVIGLGAGGHSEVIVEILRGYAQYELAGLLAPNGGGEDRSAGLPILGGDELLAALFADGIALGFNGIGGFGDGLPHRRVFERAKAAGFEMLCVKHPSAVVSPSAQIGEGSVIFAQAVVNTKTRLGCNVIVNTGASVDHHCVIEDHVHLAPGVRLAGAVTVGEGAQIGIGAVVREGVSIGRGAVIGAGAVVLHDIPEGMLAVGVPAAVRTRSV